MIPLLQSSRDGKRFFASATGFSLVLLLMPAPLSAYPTDPAAQEYTKIRRLKWQQDINERTRRGTRIPEGAQWPMNRIKLRMLDNPSFDVGADTVKDQTLQKGLKALLRKYGFRRYNVAILDITDPKNPRWAGIRETQGQTPGSTAKVLLGAGLLRALKERFPDPKDRAELLRKTVVTADNWAMRNHHEIPVIDAPIGEMPGDPKVYRSRIRAVHTGDKFTLWEWMDHALSPSSNASASMMWREATLLGLLGDEYPPKVVDQTLWERWDKETFTKAAFDTVDKPLLDAGLNVEDFNIRMFFTRGAGKYIKSESSSATPLGLLRWLMRVEQGRMVDEWSSLELKRMLYLTRRRIRYAKTRVLDRSAAVFKTGSLYRCKKEEGYDCYAYVGNVLNVLNAFISVETPPDIPVVLDDDGKPAEPTAVDLSKEVKPKLVYLVAVMSNELKRNAADDHGRLSTGIHRMIEAYHAKKTAETKAAAPAKTTPAPAPSPSAPHPENAANPL